MFRKYDKANGNKYDWNKSLSWDWRDDHPMVYVNWQEARDYCLWAGIYRRKRNGKRLPVVD
jgi:formylglycine-generating enzyme required for sulfatase activity